jgi:hypothetical protein
MNKGNQRPWRVKERSVAAPGAPRFRGAAYYRRPARDRQGNSVAIQRDLVRRWARTNGVDILHDFADRGKSGLTAGGRDENVGRPLSACPTDGTHTKAPGNVQKRG